MIYIKPFDFSSYEDQYLFLYESESENGLENKFFHMDKETFDNVGVKQIYNEQHNIDLPSYYVPQTIFFLYDNDVIVGFFKVRHYLTKALREGAGHIGYYIGKKYRHKGYATKGLKLAIEKLISMPEFNEAEVLLECNKDNIASLKTMQNCGGYITKSDNLHNLVRIKVFPKNIVIRKSKIDDVNDIEKLYFMAKDYMKLNGNSTQWQKDYPNRIDVLQDIKDDTSYVVTLNNKIIASFSLSFKKDENYSLIENGKWNYDLPYAVIHRLVSDHSFHNISCVVYDYALSLINYLRIDTHENNIPMIIGLNRYGFKKCGIVFVHNHEKRIAFDYYKE